ncbi:hypothetical protein H8356DRAFT_1326142 [Neocallimastix lanati (nom. inval.)]|nr:hypothetical protein H8356DRAFT_1326142 [Neocallimastix sp. JGI-2020a]
MEKNLIIEYNSIPYGIKIKPFYNKISKEMRFICPEYNSIKSQISRNLNKNYHPMEYNDDIFVDGTFFIAPKFSYQIFITRTYAKELDIIPSYYELIDKLNELEHFVSIERYKNIETKLIDTKCDRNNTINLWFDCLTDLNNII